MNTRKIQFISLVLFCFVLSVNAADIVRYVDTGSDAAGDGTTPATSSGDNTHAYQSLNQAEAGEQQDLTAGGGSTMTFHGNRTNGGGEDTAIVVFDGWTTASGQDITAIGDDFPADGIPDGAKSIFHTNDAIANMFSVREDFVNLQKLQIKVTDTGSSTIVGIVQILVGAGAILNVDSCIITGVLSGTGSVTGIRAGDADGTINAFNTIIIDFVSGADSGMRAFVTEGGTMNCFNCTSEGNRYGYWEISGTMNCHNCVAANSFDDFNGTPTVVDYCASDDGDGTNAQAPNGGVWTNEFTNLAGEDYSLKSGGNCVGNGTDDPGSGLYSDDIIDTARSSTWDIGAFEFVAAPAPGGQVIYIQR